LQERPFILINTNNLSVDAHSNSGYFHIVKIEFLSAQ